MSIIFYYTEAEARTPKRVPNVHNVTVNETTYFYSSFPHLDEQTTNLIHVSKGENVKIAKRNIKQVSSFITKLNTMLKKEDKANIEYSIPCRDCNRNLSGRYHKSEIRRGVESCIPQHFIPLIPHTI